MHGMILDAKFEDVNVTNNADESHVEGTFHAGNFGGHWFSSADVNVRTTLRDSYVEMEVTVKNVGQENLPLGIGWHPYFAFPSGDRQQARLHIPRDSPGHCEQLRRCFSHWQDCSYGRYGL